MNYGFRRSGDAGLATGLALPTFLTRSRNSFAEALAPDCRASASNRLRCSCALRGGSFFFGMSSPGHLHVSQPLAFDATQQLLGALLIVHAKGNAVIIPEIKL